MIKKKTQNMRFFNFSFNFIGGETVKSIPNSDHQSEKKVQGQMTKKPRNSLQEKNRFRPLLIDTTHTEKSNGIYVKDTQTPIIGKSYKFEQKADIFSEHTIDTKVNIKSIQHLKKPNSYYVGGIKPLKKKPTLTKPMGAMGGYHTFGPARQSSAIPIKPKDDIEMD